MAKAEAWVLRAAALGPPIPGPLAPGLFFYHHIAKTAGTSWSDDIFQLGACACPTQAAILTRHTSNHSKHARACQAPTPTHQPPEGQALAPASARRGAYSSALEL